jgi:hypothetical protein
MLVSLIPLRTLVLLDAGAFSLLGPVLEEALDGGAADIDLQVEHVGPVFWLRVTTLRGDIVVGERDLMLGTMESLPQRIQVSVMWLWTAVLGEKARRTRERALRGIREIERAQASRDQR